jgi:hypothetical protein
MAHTRDAVTVSAISAHVRSLSVRIMVAGGAIAAGGVASFLGGLYEVNSHGTLGEMSGFRFALGAGFSAGLVGIAIVAVGACGRVHARRLRGGVPSAWARGAGTQADFIHSVGRTSRLR